MARQVAITSLIARADNNSNCAHGCRYCPIRRHHSRIERDLYVRLIERIREWQARERPGLNFWHELGYHSNYERADLESLRRLEGDQAVRGITLGGLPQRSDEELTSWLTLLG